MSEQATFIKNLADLGDKLYLEYERAKSTYDLFWANGFNSGGAKALGTEHITESGVETDLNEITSMMTLVEQLANFYENRAVAQADYKSTLNKIRMIILDPNRRF